MFCQSSNCCGQWRELNSIFKKQDKHILINFIYDYPKEQLLFYTDKVIEEFDKRGYKINKLENYKEYFKDINNVMYIFTVKNAVVYKNKMNEIYLRECLYNLEEKAFCGGISKEEWQKIYNKFKDFTELWDGE